MKLTHYFTVKPQGKRFFRAPPHRSGLAGDRRQDRWGDGSPRRRRPARPRRLKFRDP